MSSTLPTRPPLWLLWSLLLAISSIGAAHRVSAEELTPRQNELFEIHVRPTLVAHCIECHGEQKQRGGLKLTSQADVLQGGLSGPAVVPGEPEESLLLEALRYESLEMPPTGRLASEVADGIEAWIEAGAPWPQDVVLRPTPKISPEGRQWWCYQPIDDPPVPDVDSDAWCRNEIDRFILARLEHEGIEPAAEADPRVLTRRVHFALTGLPPQADATVVPSEDYAALVDRLLDDPAYGENQARFWLDLVRYADSDGYNADHARPEAHRYRDYVIRSFNEDKPYDRFVTEQLAGDEVDPGNRDALVATMYLRHWIYEWNQRDVEGQWQEILNDITENVADVFLAQGLKCARCHDHKFDPLLQKDYFRLKAFFAPFQPREDLPVADLPTRREHYRKQKAWEEATDEIRAELHAIENPVLLENSTREGVDKFVTEIRAMIAERPCERTPYEHQIASLASRQFDVHPEKLPEWLGEQAEVKRQRLLERLAEFDYLKPEPLPTMEFVASDVGPVAPPTVIPGDAEQTPIQPGFPAILEDQPAAEIIPPPEALQSTGRRTALARWITDPENPLTARVIVNRIWQQHFGRGLVATSSDFGRLGTPPSHPKLLDWLASRFVEDGWSIKQLHRRILTSATYRQTSLRAADEHLAKVDPENRLLWRANPRRLAAEEIHDTLLAASGELTRDNRAIYKTVKRNRLNPLLKLFDFPDRIRSQCKRHRTTTSPQALLMMNDPWMHQRAAALVADLDDLDHEAFVRTAYQRLFFRSPGREELEMAQRFRSSYTALTSEPETPDRVESITEDLPAIRLDADQPTSVRVPWFDELPEQDFTVEATVRLDSLYPDASVRTIAAHWSGDSGDPGWALGVTSTQSAYEPRNLILQLVGSRGEGGVKYEVIASDLRLELNKPYYVAVSVDLDDPSDQGVTFVVQDLSAPEAEPRIAHAPHHARRNIRPQRAVEIGGRSNRHLWDGLIHNVRLHDAALDPEQLATNTSQRLLFDIRFADDDRGGIDASGNGRHAAVDAGEPALASPERQARQSLLHALLISNETIYVD